MNTSKCLAAFLCMLLLFSCKQEKQIIEKEKQENKQVNEFALVIHGGAGYQTRASISPELDSLVRKKMEEALQVGHGILKNGGKSLDAVEQTIKVLEDSPLFNAGKGAVFTNEETNELDASIMDGSNLDAGAVAGVTKVRNPISAARMVMENSPHVMLSGEGANQFAQEKGLRIVDPKYFATEKNLERVKKIKERELQKVAFLTKKHPDEKFGTVGCVALDKSGNIAAGTSTGGMTNKKWNRIGDAPIIGAGTYANNKTCGVSSTGHGEYFIRAAVAHDISAKMEYKSVSLDQAAKEVVQKKLVDMKGEGGIIAIDSLGNIQMEFNTKGMYRASIDDEGKVYTGIYKDE
ncbi:isoaspartyl peptidase/L-asparaginase family protein [Pseudofulvibacter geojedonensis]|uniref:Isoaspartyl peptidase/L-asparaginase family protein n=1 Tax=Pseudofulvibacter geojedonensis TaxID=1123758 RepID=A0ABW3I690_9FLAO